MSVSSVTQVSVVASEDIDGNSTYVVTYRVIVTAATDGPRTCFASGLLPGYGSTYSFGSDSNLWAFYRYYSNFRWEDDKHRLAWLVDITFDTKPTTTKPQSPWQNPLDEPWKVSGSFTDLQLEVDRDRNGNKICNSSDEPKTRVIPYGHDTVHLEGYSATISLSQRAQAVKHVNSAAIWGLAARKVLLRTWSYQIVYNNSDPFVKHVMDFEINYDGWNENFIDAGTRTKLVVGGTPYYTPITNKDIKERGEVYLDGSGQILNTTTTPAGYTLSFEAIDEFDFLTIPSFPNPLPGPFV